MKHLSPALLNSEESNIDSNTVIVEMAPAFYRILLDPSSPHLSLPPAFVSKHWAKGIPNSTTIQSADGGYSWKVKIKKIGETCWFVDEWINVVNDIQLRFGNLLVFRLLDESIFKLIVYSPDGCEKILTHKSQDLGCGDEIDENDSDGDDDEEEKQDADDDENSEDGIDEDDDEEDEVYGDDEETNNDKNGADPLFVSIMTKANTKYLRFPVRFMKAAKICAEGTMVLKNHEGNEWVMGVKLDKSFRQSERYLLSSGWCGFRRKNNLSPGDKCVFKFLRREKKLLLAKVTKKIKPEDDDGEVYGDDEVYGVNEEKKEDAGDNNDCDENGNNEDGNAEDDDEEKGDDNNGADPFFEYTMTKANKKYLRFPVSFMKAARIRAEGTILLKNLEGNEWVMGVKLDKSFRRSERYLLSSGWCGFRRENNLSQGDKCVFKFIRSEKKLLLAEVIKKIGPEE